MDKKKELELKMEEIGISFPGRIKLILTRQKGKQSILVNPYRNTKIKIDNIKFSDLVPLFFSDTTGVCLSVKDYQNFDEFYQDMEIARKTWTEGEQNEPNT